MRTDVRCEAHRILHFIGIAIATPATPGTLKCPGAAERTTTTTKKRQNLLQQPKTNYDSRSEIHFI